MANNYIVSALKYRPTTFRDVLGQQALTHTLKAAIASDRLAHAYLFCGPRGVGKTTCARIFAKTINCENRTPDGEACNECPSCRAFNEQRSFNITELDAASNNSVDDIRNITEQVRIPPQTGRYRVFIIDEVHMLTTAAFNAFLKTLEEPPEYVIFILATTEKQKVLPTILSRCQIYDFARITVPDIVKELQHICQEEHIEAETAALNVIAKKADGAMRDALSIFDQVTASSGGHITYQSAIDNLNILDYDYYFRLVDAFLAGDVPTALLIYKEIRDKGFDSLFFVNGLMQHLRDLMVASTPSTLPLLEMNDDVAQQYQQQAAKLSPQLLYRAMDLCNQCDLNYRNASSKLLLVELTLIKLCQLTGTPQPPTGGNGGGSPLKKVNPTPSSSTAATPSPAAPAASNPASAQATAPQPAAHAANMPEPPVVAEPPITATTQPATTHVAPPAQAATAKPQPSTAAKRHSLLHGKPAGRALLGEQFSFHSQEKKSDDDNRGTARREAYTLQQLQEAWQRYIDQHPNQILITNAMQATALQKTGDDAYSITVANQGQVELMNDSMGEILASLRHDLANDFITIKVELSKKPMAHVPTRREIIEDFKKNPEFVKLVKEFNLSLA